MILDGTGCPPSLPTHPSQIPASSYARLFGSSLVDPYQIHFDLSP